MDALELTTGHWILRAADDVFEAFGDVVLGSQRIHLRHLAVGVERRKNGDLRVRTGLAPSPDAPFYAGSAVVSGGTFMIDVPADQEPPLRSFLDQVGARTGRTLGTF
ncbi:MAG TPA: hypothetical protein VHZ06_03765 [Marmoricola sp.]|jgi:hypothetical protein|nr:hypothetical protein [Marmoricola sp.]